MPANDDRRSPKSRRPLVKTISIAAAAIGALAPAACSSTTTAPAATTPVAATAAGPGSAGTLTGAGSTYVAPFLALALARYHQQHPAVTVSYSPVGSSAGIAAISTRQVNFGASDVAMNLSELKAAQGGPVTQVPDALAAEGIAYNVSLPAGTRLHLTDPVLAEISLGQVTSWNDPAITALNPGITLPGAPITVVHRSDGSGTTYIFSNYLSSVSPAWAARVGTGKTLSWPAGQGAEGNDGVASAIYRTSWSIANGRSRPTPRACSCRSPKSATRPGTTSCPPPQTTAAAEKPDITPTDFSIVNQPGAGSYPITGYSWALIYTRQTDQATGQALVTMLNWLTHAG
jgi:phosphate transport system substrate-binding protein